MLGCIGQLGEKCSQWGNPRPCSLAGVSRLTGGGATLGGVASGRPNDSTAKIGCCCDMRSIGGLRLMGVCGREGGGSGRSGGSTAVDWVLLGRRAGATVLPVLKP